MKLSLKFYHQGARISKGHFSCFWGFENPSPLMLEFQSIEGQDIWRCGSMIFKPKPFFFKIGRFIHFPLAQGPQTPRPMYDLRGIIYTRNSNPNCIQRCKNYKELCERMRMNQLRIFQYLKFTPKRFR